jgi:hypothetical protein
MPSSDLCVLRSEKTSPAGDNISAAPDVLFEDIRSNAAFMIGEERLRLSKGIRRLPILSNRLIGVCVNTKS